jgi:hypothetical protein
MINVNYCILSYVSKDDLRLVKESYPSNKHSKDDEFRFEEPFDNSGTVRR